MRSMASRHNGRVHCRSMKGPLPHASPRLRRALHDRATRTVQAILLAALAALTPGAVAAQPAAGAPNKTMLFEPIGVYELEIDGKVVPKVKMFHSPEAQAVLVITPSLPYPIAAVPRNKTIQKLEPSQLVQDARGAMTWTPTGSQMAVATFDLVDSKPVFQLDGKKIRFLDKPPLLGPHTKAEIVAYDPSYAYREASANPPKVYLDKLEAWDEPVRVKIFFSTQCQVCRDLLPGVFKFISQIKNPKFKFEFYGMPLPASKDPLANELKITDFPTGILYGADGKEIGRAHGHSWRMPDLAIHNALLGITIDPEALRAQPPGADAPPGGKMQPGVAKPGGSPQPGADKPRP